MLRSPFPALWSTAARKVPARSLAPALALAVGCATGSNDATTTFVTNSSDGAADATVTSTDDGASPITPIDFGNDAMIVAPSGDDAGEAGPLCDGSPCATDFPSAPLVDPSVSPTVTDPATLFVGAGSTTGGPCLVEPADNALYPYNWLRPRILWTAPAAGVTDPVYEVRIHADPQQNDYVVYTKQNYWTLDLRTWRAIAGVEGGAKGTLVGKPIRVTVRAASSAGGGAPVVSNTAQFVIAPAIADGSLIYWTAVAFDMDAKSTDLQGFRVGDEGTSTVLRSSDVKQPVRAIPVSNVNSVQTAQPGQVWCIGCHTATPDGNYVSFTAQWPWPDALASVQSGSAGAEPPWLSQGAIQNLSPNLGNQSGLYYGPPAVDQLMLGIQTFSGGHYAPGDRIMVSSVGAAWNSGASASDPGQATGVTSQLAWFDLEWNNAVTTDGGLLDGGLPVAPCTPLPGPTQPCLTQQPSNGGWGWITRTGDTRSAGAPSWSHADVTGIDSIAYASTTTGTKDGRMNCLNTAASSATGDAGPDEGANSTCTSDVYVVPYGAMTPGPGGAGGAASALPGASDPMYNEYYPAWSPDDTLVAFNRVAVGSSMYNQPLAEVWVVPYNGGKGGTPVRLNANDPVACTKLASPGVQNTWPKWAPNPVPLADAGSDAGADGGPAPQTIDGLTYYWITFSSSRSPTSSGKQQLYVAGIVVDAAGTLHTYAPIYLWNQDDTVNNLIPSWGEFSIPPGMTPPPAPPVIPPPK